MGRYEDMKRAAANKPKPQPTGPKPNKGKAKSKKKPRRKMTVIEIEALYAKKGTRLPHGSKFAIEWDATKQMWSGKLSVPRVVNGEPAVEVFEGSSGGAFRLLGALDDLFRATQEDKLKSGVIPKVVQSGKDGVR